MSAFSGTSMVRPSFRVHWLVMTISVVCRTVNVSFTEGFAPVPMGVSVGTGSCTSAKPLVHVGQIPQNVGRFRECLQLQKGWFVPDNEDGHGKQEDDSIAAAAAAAADGGVGDRDEEQQNQYRYVTREMLQRDLLSDPQVKRKNKKKGGYIPRDNRDHLPYVVKQITPDPYTKFDVKKSKQVVSKPNGGSKRSDLELIGSRLSIRAANKNDASTILGEFQLDKSTTSGDIICISDRTYKVETARCQYKYAGGQRFVMVRKILEVKEITRAIQEAQLEKQLALSVGPVDDADKTNNL